MKTQILGLAAAASLLGGAAMAQQPTYEQQQQDYQAKQSQYQDKKAQYEDQKDQYQNAKSQYHHEMREWAAGQAWPERYWGDHYVVNDWGVVHLRDPGKGYRWYRDDNGDYVRVARGTHVIEEVVVHDHDHD